MGGPERHDVRIDYIQHNISAFAGFAAIRDPASGAEPVLQSS